MNLVGSKPVEDSTCQHGRSKFAQTIFVDMQRIFVQRGAPSEKLSRLYERPHDVELSAVTVGHGTVCVFSEL